MLIRAGRLALAAAVLVLGTAAPAPAASDIQEAAALLEAGKPVEAWDALTRLRVAASGDERARVIELLRAAEERIRFLDPVELDLQRARVALANGDLRAAERHATRVRTSDRASTTQRIAASDALDRASELKVELEPLVGPALEQAVRDFMNERYAEAKAGLASVDRSAVELSPADERLLRRHQDAIVKLERERGVVFEVAYVPMSVLRGGPASIAAAETAATAAAAAAAGQTGGDLFAQADEIDAQRVLAEAGEAFEAGRYGEARRLYNRALTVYAQYLSDEELDLARDRVARADARLGAATGDIIDETITERALIREQAAAIVDDLEDRARRALEAGRFEEARRLIAQAQLEWNNANAQGVLAEDAYQRRAGELADLLDRVEQEEIVATERAAERAAAEAREEERDRQARLEEERAAAITENLERLRQLQMEQQYEEALRVVEQILFLDPNNPAALLMQDAIREIVLYRKYEEVQRDKAFSLAQSSLEAQQGMVIPDEDIAYPPDWPEISVRRGLIRSFTESEEDRRVLAQLESQRLPASFDDNTLEDILTFVATVTNLNFDVDWDSLEQIGIERDERVTLELREVSARVVLDRVLEKASPDDFSRAGWAVQDGIVVVAAEEDLRRNTFIVIYDVRDLLFEITNYDNVPQLDLDQALQQGGGGGGGGGGGLFEDEDDEFDRLTEAEQLENLLEIIQTNVDFEGWRENGGETGIVQILKGNLIITNTAKNHRQIQRLLDKLREIRQIQISVETRILQVSTDFFERIGFDLDVYFNGGDQFQAANDQLEAFGFGTLAGEGTNLLVSDLIGADQTGLSPGNWVIESVEDDGTVSYVFTEVPFSVPTNTNGWGIIPAQQGSDNITQTLLEGLSGFAQTLGGLNPALGVSGTFLDDIQVDFLVEATQADRRAVTLNAPRLTFTNGRAANIFVNNQRAYVSGLNAVVGTSSVAFDPEVDVLNTGFSLLLRGVVSADRRYVTLDAQISLAELVSFTNVTQSAAAGGTGGSQGGGIATGTFQLPEVIVTRVLTGVTVPDQGTALLGGQRLTTEYDVESGVPILSKIPIINRFFTNTATAKEESTLLVLLRPKILITSEQEEDAFPGLQDTLANPF